MNKLMIIGNLTRDPERRELSDGKSVVNFTVAVNRRQKREQNSNQPEADFFRVFAWNNLGELCQKYLTKGKKVAVVGPVSIHVYKGNDGEPKGSLELMAENVEFLSPAGNGNTQEAPAQTGGFTAVETDEMPF